MRKWRITYLPTLLVDRDTEWEFEGSEFELDEYLQKNHSCSCSDCEGVYWWNSYQACEYEVVEITEEE
jgi:hypothetical protein